MTLLNAEGQPVTSKRRTILRLQLIDQKPGASKANQHQMSFEIDTTEPAVVKKVLDRAMAQTIQKLMAMGVLQRGPSHDGNGISPAAHNPLKPDNTAPDPNRPDNIASGSGGEPVAASKEAQDD